MNSYNQLREFLADIEHQQWICWSKSLTKELILIRDRIVNPHTNHEHTYDIINNRLKRWEKLWKPYKKLTFDEKEQDREWADKILDNLPSKCPMYQCGGLMVMKKRPYPKGINEDNFPDGMAGDNQSPDLVCTNCKAVYHFDGFKNKRKLHKPEVKK